MAKISNNEMSVANAIKNHLPILFAQIITLQGNFLSNGFWVDWFQTFNGSMSIKKLIKLSGLKPEGDVGNNPIHIISILPICGSVI